jgi:hypothetical protein
MPSGKQFSFKSNSYRSDENNHLKALSFQDYQKYMPPLLRYMLCTHVHLNKKVTF